MAEPDGDKLEHTKNEAYKEAANIVEKYRGEEDAVDKIVAEIRTKVKSMNDDQIDRMPAGKDMDALVSEHIMANPFNNNPTSSIPTR